MTEKEYILEILTKLRGSWDLSQGLIDLIETSDVSEKTLATLIRIIENAAKNITNSETLRHMEASLALLRESHSRETQERAREIEKLDTLFDNL
jgi:hypothetical protein